jgi:F-type H+-transporting ATPase subunit alpha
MKKVSGGLRLDMAAYHEIASFAQFGSIWQFNEKTIGTGRILQEVLKQPQYSPYSVSDEFLIFMPEHTDILTGAFKSNCRWEEDF